MFQKLYKHLEEMNTHLRQQQIHIDGANQQGGKVSGQLETINNAILVQNELLASQNMLAKEALVHRKGGLAPILQVVNLVLCCAGIVIIILFSYYTFKLSHLTQALTTGQPPASRQISIDKLSRQTQEAIDQQSLQQQHLARLDSLISEQARGIQELRKLNTVAVRTFSHIKRHLELADSLAKTASVSSNP
ncbi:MAG TPA: hypothetical protein VL832_18720 [Puia sp.]|jgi:hypothetical protein|nr:hypothetical protein [Puia sp.]